MLKTLNRQGIITPARGSQRPLWPFKVNTDSSQAEGLVGWWVFVPGLGLTIIDLNLDKNHDATGGNKSSTDPVCNTDIEAMYGMTFKQDSSNTGNYARVNGSSSDLSITGEYSVMAWVRPTDLSGFNTIISKRSDADTNRGPHFDLRESGKINWGFRTGGLWKEWKTTNVVCFTGVLYNILVTYNETDDALIYHNGIVEAANTIASPPAISTNSRDYCIASYFNSSNVLGEAPFGGDIFEVRIYNKIISPELAWQMYDPHTRWELASTLRDQVFVVKAPAVVGGRVMSSLAAAGGLAGPGGIAGVGGGLAG